MCSLVKFVAIALCVVSVAVKTVHSQDCMFTWENGTEIPDIDFGISLEKILDTTPPGTPLLTLKANNVKKITSVNSNSLSGTVYMEPTLNETHLLLKLTDHFVEYEENENSVMMKTTVSFECAKGTSYKIEFNQPIEDTNNHAPIFLDEPYIYTLPMPFPKNVQLNMFKAISARDIDIANDNITFSLDPADPNNSGFSVSWLSRDEKDRKRFYATLVTSAVINYVEDVTFTLKATDAGTPVKSSTTTITIKVDRDNSILRFERPLYIADLTELTPEEANGKVIFADGEISLGGGADKTVEFSIHDDFTDYGKNFDLKVSDDHSTVSVRLVDPPTKFFDESFVVLSLTATKSASVETTVIHISLPGRATVPGSSTTPPTTDSSGNGGDGVCSSEQEECDSLDYIVAIIILAILLLATSVGLVVTVLMNCRIRRKTNRAEQVSNGGHHIMPEMGEIRNGSVSPNPSLKRTVAFNDTVEEMKIARL